MPKWPRRDPTHAGRGVTGGICGPETASVNGKAGEPPVPGTIFFGSPEIAESGIITAGTDIVEAPETDVEVENKIPDMLLGGRYDAEVVETPFFDVFEGLSCISGPPWSFSGADDPVWVLIWAPVTVVSTVRYRSNEFKAWKAFLGHFGDLSPVLRQRGKKQ